MKQTLRVLTVVLAATAMMALTACGSGGGIPANKYLGELPSLSQEIYDAMCAYYEAPDEGKDDAEWQLDQRLADISERIQVQREKLIGKEIPVEIDPKSADDMKITQPFRIVEIVDNINNYDPRFSTIIRVELEGAIENTGDCFFNGYLYLVSSNSEEKWGNMVSVSENVYLNKRGEPCVVHPYIRICCEDNEHTEYSKFDLFNNFQKIVIE